jgi:hypothetical protein
VFSSQLEREEYVPEGCAPGKKRIVLEHEGNAVSANLKVTAGRSIDASNQIE